MFVPVMMLGEVQLSTVMNVSLIKLIERWRSMMRRISAKSPAGFTVRRFILHSE